MLGYQIKHSVGMLSMPFLSLLCYQVLEWPCAGLPTELLNADAW